MNSGEALQIALRSVSETRQLLESLITSSESFDYIKAKAALKQLQRRVRELEKLQKQLAAQQPAQPNIRLVDFRAAGLEAGNQ